MAKSSPAANPAASGGACLPPVRSRLDGSCNTGVRAASAQLRPGLEKICRNVGGAGRELDKLPG